MAEIAPQQVYLPFSLFYPIHRRDGFSTQANVIFQGNKSVGVENKEFTFFQGTLARVELVFRANHISNSLPDQIPYFSLAAIFLLIIFRNRFYTSFLKYFLNFKGNYEIDFNFQRIGFFPILFCLLIIFFASSDLFFLSPIYHSERDRILLQVKSILSVLALPIFFSCLLFFLLDFSGKLFPILFSDLKALFYLSLLVLIWNFSTFGSGIEKYISKDFFLLGLGIFYLILRSYFFLKVFQKSYRFRIPISLFYICTLNLTTFLFFTKGLPKDIFRFL
jgi:hypothetical protein